ncbi:MAG: DUF488 domain-containing protein [Proteobacteria bacterium]|nr:DUF488 domain-containing protein [Pseudomonadota bacterium]
MTETTLSTIGYEGASLDGFVAALKEAGIATLIDVREVPWSRKRGFAKPQLAAALDEAGIDYVHLKGLGTPKPGREAARARRIEDWRAIFARHMETPEFAADLARAAAIARESSSCLMCMERDPARCHRTLVAERLAREHGFAVRPLMA